MRDAAHAESLDHEVYSKPLKVEPKFEAMKTPEHYRGYPDGDKLPDKMRVWRVQNSGKQYGGVVAQGYGFADSPDAEIIALGVNRKAYGNVGIGRHGNILQWGYWAPPSQMTDAGKKLFINCVHYISRFDGKRCLIRKSCHGRMEAIGRAKELAKYYRDNFELIYYYNTFRVDSELKSLGITSNRTVDALERLISLLKDEAHAETARSLLARYTTRSFQSPEQWRSWFEQNEDRIFFTDVGGYKFHIVPEGYLDKERR